MAQGHRQEFSGVYRATVTNNRDPKKQRRLQVEVSTSVGHSTEWIWPMEPANITTEVPDIGQGVWVLFQSADHEYPVWFGSFGKHKGKSKKIYIKTLPNSVSLTGLTDLIKTKQQDDGTTEVDLVETIVAMANVISALQTDLESLQTTLATRTSPTHTHTSAG